MEPLMDDTLADEDELMSDRKRRPWSNEEDEILRKRIKTYGLNNWSLVADGLPGRSGKSCSERWRIYLTPGVKRPTLEPFSEYETAVIYLGQLVHGNQWSSIAKLLPGRTNTAIKNFWKTALATAEHKRVRINRYVQQGHTLETLLANPPSPQELAASAARRRRAAAAAAAAAKQDTAAVPPSSATNTCSSPSAAATAAAPASSGSTAAYDADNSSWDGMGGIDYAMDCMTSPSDHPDLCDDADLHVADLADDWDLSDGTDILMEEAGADSAADWQMQQPTGEHNCQPAGDGSSSDSQEVAAQQLQQSQEPAAALPVMVPQSTASASAFSGCMMPVQQQQQQQSLSVAVPSGFQGQDVHGMISPAGSNTAAVYPVDAAAASMYHQQPTMQQMMAVQGYANMQQQYMMHTQQQYWQQPMQQQAYQMMYVNWVPAADGGGDTTAAEPVSRQQQQHGGKGKHSNKRGRTSKNGNGHYSAKPCSSDDEDSEEARAAAAAAAAAIASGAIQLNPNVHPAAAAAAAADAARAAARAAARKAASSAASARKKSKAKAAAVAAGKLDRNGSISDSDECHPGAQQLSEEGTGRQKRKAASGVTKAVAAITGEDNQTEQLDTEAQVSPADEAAEGVGVAQPTSSKTAQSDETAVGSSDLSPDESGVAAAATQDAAAAAATQVALSIDDHLDDPIMMELYKHEMSIAKALAAPAAHPQQQQAPVAEQQQNKHKQDVAAVVNESATALPATCESPTATAAAAMNAVKPTSSSSSGVAEAAGTTAAPPCSVSTPDSTAAVAAATVISPPEEKPLEKLPAAAAPTATATPVIAPLKRQQSANIPAAASSAGDSEGSVFTASSRTSISITSSQSAPMAPAAAAVSAASVGTGGLPMGRPFGLKGTGLPAPAFEQGYYVTFTAANGQQQQVLVQPAGHSSTRTSSSGSDMSGVTPNPAASMAMMGPAVTHMGPGVTHPGVTSYTHTAAPAAAPLHHNPVVAAMLAQMQSPGNCPILHATMAALANPAGCTCVYCVTTGKCQRGTGGYMPAAPPPPMAAPLTAAAPKPASSAMLMPPPRPVIMPGKSAAAAAAAAAVASSQAAVGLNSGFYSTAVAFTDNQANQAVPTVAAATFDTQQSEQNTVQFRGSSAAAAAASMAAAEVPHHDWTFDDIDVDDLDFTLDHADYSQHDAAIAAAAIN